ANNISEYKVEYLKSIARMVINLNFHKEMIPYILKGHYNCQKEIASSVDILLPNSPTELERVREDMEISDKQGQVVANAVDLSI
ncbi:hypothetical protein WB403_51195, partial [Streptomyces brasiliscabiei]